MYYVYRFRNQNIWANAQLPRIRPFFSNFLHSADNRTIAHLCMIIFSRNSKILKGFKFLVLLVLQTFKNTKTKSLSRSSLLFPPLTVPLIQQRVIVILSPWSNLIQKKNNKRFTRKLYQLLRLKNIAAVIL